MQIVAVCDVNRESAGYWEGKVGGREPARRLVEEYYAKHRRDGDLSRLLAPRAISASSSAAPTSTPSKSARPTTGTRSWSIEACKAEEGHLLPEAALAHDRRRPGDVVGGQPVACRLSDRQPAAIGPAVSPGLRARSQRANRRSDQSARRHAGRSNRLRQDRRPQKARAGARRVSTTTAGSARRPMPHTPRPAATSTSAGSTTTPAETSPTGAATTPTAPVGHGNRDDRPGRDSQRQGASSLPTRSGTPPPNITSRPIYENGIPMIVSNQEKMGVTFEGTKGKIYVNRGTLEAEPASILDSKIGAGRHPSLHERRPLPQLHRLRDITRAHRGTGRSRSPLHHHLPPGQHRHAVEPPEAALGPAHRADHRRRRGVQNAQSPLPLALDACNRLSRRSVGHPSNPAAVRRAVGSPVDAMSTDNCD